MLWQCHLLSSFFRKNCRLSEFLPPKTLVSSGLMHTLTLVIATLTPVLVTLTRVSKSDNSIFKLDNHSYLLVTGKISTGMRSTGKISTGMRSTTNITYIQHYLFST